MTTVNAVYDSIITKCEAAFPSHKRIPNPYAVEAATPLIAEKAFGVSIGAGEPPRGEVSRIQSERAFDVLIVRAVHRTDHDVTGRESADKAMLSDYAALRSAIETDPTLGQTVSDTSYTGDSGIGFLSGDRFRFMVMTVSFTVRFYETLA